MSLFLKLFDCFILENEQSLKFFKKKPVIFLVGNTPDGGGGGVKDHLRTTSSRHVLCRIVTSGRGDEGGEVTLWAKSKKKKKRLILCTAHENVDGTRERGHLARGTK